MNIRPQDAYKLIAKFGQTLTLTKTADGTYDPALGTFTTTDSTSSFSGYFYNHKDVDTDQTVFGNRKLIISSKGLTATPSVGDKVSGLGEEVTIQVVRKIYDGDSVILYICGVND